MKVNLTKTLAGKRVISATEEYLEQSDGSVLTVVDEITLDDGRTLRLQPRRFDLEWRTALIEE